MKERNVSGQRSASQVLKIGISRFNKTSLSDEMKAQEEELNASSKQLNQFFRRFNGEESEKGKPKKPREKVTFCVKIKKNAVAAHIVLYKLFCTIKVELCMYVTMLIAVPHYPDMIMAFVLSQTNTKKSKIKENCLYRPQRPP